MKTSTQKKYIDSHQHFWHYHPKQQGWISDDMSVIRKDFLPSHLGPLLKENEIDGCVAVQADQTEAETHFLLALANQHSFIKGVVGWVDLCNPAIEERLAYFRQFPLLKGFRHVLQGEEPAFMLQPDFLRGIGLLKKYQYTYDLLILPRHIPAAIELVKLFPEQAFVVDHLAKPLIKNGIIEDWATNIKMLAKQPNVNCKISGMVTEADFLKWKQSDFIPYIDIIVEAFGIDRIMFGSDWPVCEVAASYSEMFAIVTSYFAKFSMQDQAKFFGENATQFYHL
jgi:L-fuconolactonase